MPMNPGALKLRAVLLALLLAPAASYAGECFCLVDADDNVWFDCTSYHPRLSPHPKFFCRDIGSGLRVKVADGHELQRIAAGTAPCTPCRLADEVEGEAIRGDEEQRQGDATPTGATP